MLLSSPSFWRCFRIARTRANTLVSQCTPHTTHDDHEGGTAPHGSRTRRQKLTTNAATTARLSLCAMIIVQMHSCVARAVSADAVNAKNHIIAASSQKISRCARSTPFSAYHIHSRSLMGAEPVRVTPVRMVLGALGVRFVATFPGRSPLGGIPRE